MKHLDEFIVERRNYVNYKKYNDFLKNKISKFTDIHELVIYSESDEIIIYMTTVGSSFTSKFIDYINKEFNEPYFRISPKNSYQLEMMVYDIPKEYLDKLDVEMNIKKYNL